MKLKLRASNWKEILVQLLVMGGLGFLLILAFFYIYLPVKTNHGDTQTVPNLIGRPFEEQVVKEWITNKEFRYKVVEDSVFDPEYPPLTILRQDPKPGSKVKSNRKIYISLNRSEPPKVRMPYLIDGSIKNAQEVLRSNGLELGKITYKPDLALNAVLEQWQGDRQFTKKDQKAIQEGIKVNKGSTIDLVVGDGLGRQRLSVPNVVGLDYEEAEFVLTGNGLQVGSTIYMGQVPDTLSVYIESDTINERQLDFLDAGRVVRQKPDDKGTIRVGDEVDLWLSGTEADYKRLKARDSLKNNNER